MFTRKYNVNRDPNHRPEKKSLTSQDQQAGYKVQPNALGRDERTLEHNKTSNTGDKKGSCLAVNDGGAFPENRIHIANFLQKRPNYYHDCSVGLGKNLYKIHKVN
jgi:hypothetical protein